MRLAFIVAIAFVAGSAMRAPPPWRAAPATHAVAMRGVAYLPARLVLALGDTVVWTNEDLVVHTVTADTASWDSGDIAVGKRYRVVATRRGIVTYHCELHPTMKGTLVVR